MSRERLIVLSFFNGEDDDNKIDCKVSKEKKNRITILQTRPSPDGSTTRSTWLVSETREMRSKGEIKIYM